MLVLSGRASELDRLRGFDRGCDEYMTKPFSYQELLARIRALLRRSRDRARVTFGLLCVSSPPAGSKLGTTRGAAEGLLIVGCGYPGRHGTHGWPEAPLKVLLRCWAHGNARPDAESMPEAPVIAAAAPAKPGREAARPVRRRPWRAVLAWPPGAGHGISLEPTGPVPGAARLGRVAGPLLAVAVTAFAAAQYAIGHPLAPEAWLAMSPARPSRCISAR